MTSFAQLFLALFILLVPVRSSERSWTLSHAVTTPSDPTPVFQKRGTVELSLQESDPPLLFSIADQSAVDSKKILEKDAYYHLELKSKDGVPLVATVPACQLRRANFRDEFAFTLDSKGDILSFSYQPLVSPLAPPTCTDFSAQDEVLALDSRFAYATTVPGMTLRNVLPEMKPPPGLKMIPGASNPNRQQQGGSGEKQDVPPPNTVMGFLQRYWMILLPMFILNFMTAPQEKPGQQQQQGAGEQQQQQSGAQQAKPTAGAKRRGKRG